MNRVIELYSKIVRGYYNLSNPELFVVGATCGGLIGMNVARGMNSWRVDPDKVELVYMNETEKELTKLGVVCGVTLPFLPITGPLFWRYYTESNIQRVMDWCNVRSTGNVRSTDVMKCNKI